MDLLVLDMWSRMVPCYGRTVEMDLVGYLIFHLMCPLRTHIGISE